MLPQKQQFTAVLILCMALLSGASGLAYQVVWFKRFCHVWGNSTLAAASVITSFLIGLAVGAYVFGTLVRKVRDYPRVYGLLEIGTGLLALTVPFQISILHKLHSVIYQFVYTLPLVHSVLRVLLTLLVLGPPTLLIGGTLPILVEARSVIQKPFWPSVAKLYALNTVGGALGCYIAGFYSCPILGLHETNFLAVCLNLLIGLLALTLPSIPLQLASEFEAIPDEKSTVGWSIPIVVILTGAASLSLEIIWTRQLSLILGGSTYAFSSMLFVLLLGIGCGSLIYHYLQPSIRNPTLIGVLIISGIIISTTIGKLLVPSLSAMVGLSIPIRATSFNSALVCVISSAAIQFLPALGMGLLFPLLVDVLCRLSNSQGKSVGTVYALNTAGSVAGVLLVSLLVLPTVGVSKSLGVAVLLYFFAILLLLPLRLNFRTSIGLFFIVIVTLTCFACVVKRENPLITDSGMYLYGYQSPEQMNSKVLYFREGISCNVLVSNHANVTTLRVNGKIDGGDGSDMPMQLGLGYYPLFLAPQSREILVIGYGTGVTVGATLTFDQIQVTCCEIEPAVFAASGHFSDVNHKAHNSQRLSMVFDDARSFLQGSKRKFDIILSEPSNPWIAGTSNLFTREFYETARESLMPRGIFAQWIQIYSFSLSEYTMVLKTFLSVFDYYKLIVISEADTILLGSMAEIGNPEDVQRAQSIVTAHPEIRLDLKQYFGTESVPSLLFSGIILDEASLLTMVSGDYVVNTDNNLRLEFDAPLRLIATKLI